MNFDIRKHTILLALSGSHAYGMAKSTSDIDVKGIAIPPKEYFYGYLKHFEQFTEQFPRDNILSKLESLVGRAVLKEEKIDATIYDIRKFFKLCADCNPSIIEVLFSDDGSKIINSHIAELICENRNLFLSTKAKYTFSGYSMQQLKRINLHRQWLLNPPDHKPTRAEFGLPEHTIISRDQLLAAESFIKVKIAEWLGSREEIPREALEDIRSRTVDAIKSMWSSLVSNCWIVNKEEFGYRVTKPQAPINEFDKIDEEKLSYAAGKLLGYDDNFLELLNMERGYRNAMKHFNQYEEWKINRNPARAELESKYKFDCKHGSHLVRLMRMCRELLEKGTVLVKRPDAEELLAIRNGAWTYEELIDWAEKQEKELTEIYDSGKSPLPRVPDHNKIDDLCRQTIEMFLG